MKIAAAAKQIFDIIARKLPWFGLIFEQCVITNACFELLVGWNHFQNLVTIFSSCAGERVGHSLSLRQVWQGEGCFAARFNLQGYGRSVGGPELARLFVGREQEWNYHLVPLKFSRVDGDAASVRLGR